MVTGNHSGGLYWPSGGIAAASVIQRRTWKCIIERMTALAMRTSATASYCVGSATGRCMVKWKMEMKGFLMGETHERKEYLTRLWGLEARSLSLYYMDSGSFT